MSYYYTFYAMESSGILDPCNQHHLFALHFVYLPRINNSLWQFMETFNNHKVSSEKNWSPNQMWANGMLHQDNPLARGELDYLEDYDLEMYGYDPNEPSPLEQMDNNVIVEPIEVNNKEIIRSFVSQTIDPLRHSPDMGVDIYTEVIDMILQFHSIT